ncbi:GTP binding domain [Dillenia turbinata]|uniref:GTP binding domain n=1 Tax=Dillenia turbinata TaxID=194707 RepID=A0AAN8ZUF8_9MAGN
MFFMLSFFCGPFYVLINLYLSVCIAKVQVVFFFLVEMILFGYGFLGIPSKFTCINGSTRRAISRWKPCQFPYAIHVQPSVGFCGPGSGSENALPGYSLHDDDNSDQEMLKEVDFTKMDIDLLPPVIIIGRPNVGKSALFNRLIRRREAPVYNAPDDHVTRDVREGIAKLSDLRFKVLDSAGLETSSSILQRTAEMTADVPSRSQFAVFLIDVIVGLQPMDLEVGKWLRRYAPGIKTILVMYVSHLMTALAHLWQQQLKTINEDLEIQLQYLPKLDWLAKVGRPNVGKSTLLNTLLQEQRVLVGPESGLMRDSVRAQFQFKWITVYLSRKNLMRAHVVALDVDAEEIANSRSSMKHAEVVIARQAVEGGWGLVVVASKMDLLRGDPQLCRKVMQAVPEEIQTIIPQVTGKPVVFVSAIEGRGRVSVMRVMMSRWKDQATQPKVKYFTQVKARPLTFVAFLSRKEFPDSEIRFVTKSH